MRSDARENYNHLLATARIAISEQGASTSLRDIARKAGMGLATLLRHFPTREALLEALLRTSLEELTQKAHTFEISYSPDEALVLWLREALSFVRIYGGVVSMMAAALSDTESALHASCEDLRLTGDYLLRRAQTEGTADVNMTGSDLFGLIGALGWLGEQPAFSSRTGYFFDVITSAILTRGLSKENEHH